MEGGVRKKKGLVPSQGVGSGSATDTVLIDVSFFQGQQRSSYPEGPGPRDGSWN